MPRYVFVRFPKEAHESFVKKKIKIEENLLFLKGKKVVIPFTKLLIAVSKSPVFMSDDYIVHAFDRKRGRHANK